MIARSHNTVNVTWPFVSFCGILPPASIDSVQYILEIAEGVDYKPGYFTRFISDVCAVDYKVVCAGINLNSTTINGLLPARWYHLRLSVEYLGQRYQSESQSIHTSTWVPSAPGMPRVNVVPIRSSFDLQNDIPVRLELMITWNPASSNGCSISAYQCQIQRFDENGQVIQSLEALYKKEQRAHGKVRYESPERDPKANQWTQSPGRSSLQIHNSIVLGERSPTRGRSRGKPGSPASGRRDHSPDRLPQVSADSLAQSSSITTSGRRFKWEILYENILASVKVDSPSADQAEWHIRVRARNSEGWSDFSPIFKMNGLTHPSLFSRPPPMYAYGTAYYSEHASTQYLDGTEGEEFFTSPARTTQSSRSAAKEATPATPTSTSVRNELFLNRNGVADARPTTFRSQKPPKPSAASAKMKSLGFSEKSEQGQGQGQNIRMDSRFDSMKSTGSFSDPVPTTASATASVGAPSQKLHVLHFKEGNNWDTAPSLASLGSFDSTPEAPSSSKKRNDSLPAINTRQGSLRMPRNRD